MIDVRELKIGNYISGKQINVFRVDEIRIKNGLYTLRMYVDQLGGHSWFDMIPGNAEPIHLTEDILRKCGFYGGLLEIGDFHLGYDTECNVSINIDDISKGLAELEHKKISSLHQLQNLYSDLAGKELDISKVLDGAK